MSDRLRVEVVFALPERQVLHELQLPQGATVAQAIAASDVGSEFPDQDIEALAVGVWGRPVARDRELVDGDRVELYRPLLMDPREARRLKAGR